MAVGSPNVDALPNPFDSFPRQSQRRENTATDAAQIATYQEHIVVNLCTLRIRTTPPPSMADHPEYSGKRSTSRTRTSRPTTPLRPSSRSSFRESARESVHGGEPFPLNTFEPAFAELSDAMADLEANMMHFQLMHESLARFSESFASFLYGLNMNAFCVDYPEQNLSDAQGSKRSRAQIQSEARVCRLQVLVALQPVAQEEDAVEPPSRKEAGLVVWPVPEAVVSDEYVPWRFRHGIQNKSRYCFPTAPDSTGVSAEDVECREVGTR
ncbi:DASH complex subunit DAM1 [Colletotrichum gloeosporioides]|uniref:DASH complex subunit DAM1 n=1 Tax=Colletotrichum gloeosporioides TaxID=474922 RepID=A0A8H4CC86_COLGL|nr:DASH complex subunit DAM1 [Colletotrichum gloeosporioides]KAF3801076.1 DASH complex subunit DAM1 [Colletotrichum gloeosporioides]